MMHGLHFSIGVSQTSEKRIPQVSNIEIRLTHAYELMKFNFCGTDSSDFQMSLSSHEAIIMMMNLIKCNDDIKNMNVIF